MTVADRSGGLVQNRQLQLGGRRHGEFAADMQAAVIGNHNALCVAMFDRDGSTNEVIAFGLEHVMLQTVASHRFRRNNELVFKLLDRHTNFDALARFEFPFGIHPVAHPTIHSPIGQLDVKRTCTRFAK
jgi:hypothetical protein